MIIKPTPLNGWGMVISVGLERIMHNKVVDDLKQGVIDEKKARTLLLGLVGVIASIFDWFEHLFWEIGWMSIQLLKGNIDGAIEMTYWIRIHLTYSGKCVGKSKLSFKQQVKNKCVAVFGLLITVGFLFVAQKFVAFLIRNINF